LEYSFETIKPGRVAGPDGSPQAPHLSVIVQGRGILRPLFTRAYFVDETESNERDIVLGAVPRERRASLMAWLVSRDAVPTYRFDIHLQGPQETVLPTSSRERRHESSGDFDPGFSTEAMRRIWSAKRAFGGSARSRKRRRPPPTQDSFRARRRTTSSAAAAYRSMLVLAGDGNRARHRGPLASSARKAGSAEAAFLHFGAPRRTSSIRRPCCRGGML
jgi:hypothetical protein